MRAKVRSSGCPSRPIGLVSAFVVYRSLETTRTSFYVEPLRGPGSVECVIADAEYSICADARSRPDSCCYRSRRTESSCRGTELCRDSAVGVDRPHTRDRQPYSSVDYCRRPNRLSPIFAGVPPACRCSISTETKRMSGRSGQTVEPCVFSQRRQMTTKLLVRIGIVHAPSHHAAVPCSHEQIPALGKPNNSVRFEKLRPPASLVRLERSHSNSHVPRGPAGRAGTRLSPGDHDVLWRLRRFNDAAIQRLCRVSSRTRVSVRAARTSAEDRNLEPSGTTRPSAESSDRLR